MRSRFDQFVKQMTSAGLRPAGPVRTDEEVSPDARRIDVYFTPVGPDAQAALAPLGLLGRMAGTACTLESFHRTPGGDEVMDCVCKHHLFRGLLRRRADEGPLPLQWIVSSGRPTAALAGLWLQPSDLWGPGIYEAPPLTFTRLVVVSELPVSRDTLLVRLMGAGSVFRRAAAELRALPEDAPERALALPILLRLRLEAPADPSSRTTEDEEFLMSTQDIVETFIEQQRSQGRNEGRNEGRTEGLVEAARELLLDLLTERFGLPPEAISAVVAHTDDRELLRDWHRLAARAPAEEVFLAIRRTNGR